MIVTDAEAAYRECRDAEPFEMRLPRLMIGEVPIGMFRQQPDHWSAERALPHIGERFVVDHIVGMAGAQQIEDIVPAPRTGRPEPCE